MRNYLPSHQWVLKGGWNIADCAARSYDLEAMHMGTVAAGRIGQAVRRRLKPFDVHLHYTDRHRLPAEVEKEPNLTFESGQFAGYAGDVWYPQPAPRDHPWRTMPHHGMTPHISGTK